MSTCRDSVNVTAFGTCKSEDYAVIVCVGGALSEIFRDNTLYGAIGQVTNWCYKTGQWDKLYDSARLCMKSFLRK